MFRDRFVAVVLVGLWLVAVSEAFAANPRQAVVHPETTDAILANPGMGWETFHRTAAEDRNLPEWIPSTVHYARWGWGTLEPEPGKIDYAFLDDQLRRSREAGQALAFRVMCCSTNSNRPYHPDWLETIGGKTVQTRYGDSPPLEVPDLDDPQVLSAHLDFIRRLGERYDGHPDIAHVDLGSVGWWGEWHMSNSSAIRMPTLQTQKKIVDAYLAAFSETRLLMLVGGEEMLEYALEQGAGWRADCLGDMGGFSERWCHMRQGYPTMLNEAEAQHAWRQAPVAWETCWDIRKWVDEGWSLHYIFNYALALHGSVINNKSAPLPEGEDVRAEVERFLRRLGYRFVLEELRYQVTDQPERTLQLEMRWRNTGSAPCYAPYLLAYRLTDDEGSTEVFAGRTTVDSWMPGSVEVFTPQFMQAPPDLPPGDPVNVTETLPLGDDLPGDRWALDVAVVDPESRKPVVQLGIAGRLSDGWYRVVNHLEE